MCKKKERSMREQYPQLIVSNLSMRILKQKSSTHKITQNALLFITKLYKHSIFSYIGSYHYIDHYIR